MQSSTSHGGRLSRSSMLWMSLVVAVWLGSIGSSAGDKFSFSMLHRFSDPVKELLSGVDGLPLPEKGTVEYYRAMVHPDRATRPGRWLFEEDGRTPLTFANGNDTYRIGPLGSLLYANVSVGTPSLSFLVALDTGSDLFWLPCDCIQCAPSLRRRDGQKIDLNIYSPNASSTGSVIPCNSTSCNENAGSRCLPDARDQCPYQVVYAANGTSSTGVLVKDVLHLTTDDDQGKFVDPKITFGLSGWHGPITMWPDDPWLRQGLIMSGYRNVSKLPPLRTATSMSLPRQTVTDGEAVGMVSYTWTCYCQAMVKGEVDDVNVIGQNFMKGYRIIFNQESMMLGWKESDCYDVDDTSLIAVSPATSPDVSTSSGS